MQIKFTSRFDALCVMRPDGGGAIHFKGGVFVAENDDDAALLRAYEAYATEEGAVAPAAPAENGSRATPPVPIDAVDITPFPFERRSYARATEPFRVVHLSNNLPHVADEARMIALAVEQAFPDNPKIELQFVTSSRGDVGASTRGTIVERALAPEDRLSVYRGAHVVVHGSAEPDDFTIEAVAAGTPVITLGEQTALADALKDAEASYTRVSAQAAKAEKQLRAARR